MYPLFYPLVSTFHSLYGYRWAALYPFLGGEWATDANQDLPARLRIVCEQLQAAAETGLGDYLTSRVEEAPASKKVVLRFGHPKAAPAKGVTVNGKPWTEFNKQRKPSP